MSGKNVPNISINKTLQYSFENCGKYKQRLDDSLEVKSTSFVTKHVPGNNRKTPAEVFELVRILLRICPFSLKSANEFPKKRKQKISTDKSSKKFLYVVIGNFKFKSIFNINKENLLLFFVSFFFFASSSACRNFRPFYFKNTN